MEKIKNIWSSWWTSTLPVVRSTLASLWTALVMSTTSVSAQDIVLQVQNKTTISVSSSEISHILDIIGITPIVILFFLVLFSPFED